MDFETRAIHAGQEPDPATGAVTVPIYQTSTFVQDAVGEHKGYDYARVANPTRTALQIALASLESAEHGIAFSSGLGATTTLMHLVNPSERVVLIADVYGGVYRMTSQVYEPKGYRFTYVPAAAFDDELPTHLDDDVRIVWVPTPSSIRRRNTSAGTPTSSAASSRRTTRRSPSASPSSRSRSARCRGRSTRGSSCAGSRRSPCACASTARTRAPSPRSSTRTTRSSASCTRASRRTRGTRW